MHLESDSILCVGAVRFGLVRFNTITNVKQQFLYQYGYFEESTINTIVKDKSGLLWLGTDENGLIKFDPRTKETESFLLEEGQGRVRSMALIHQKLYENDDLKSISFGEYLQELVSEIRSSFGMGNIQLNIEASNIHFDVDTAVPLGLIVNEMATNAFKYAYINKEKGALSIFLTEENGEYTLNIKDDGKEIPDEIDIRKTKSLGLRLVRMLSQQLEGDFKFESVNGTSFELKFAA